MTQEIIDMARQAGICTWLKPPVDVKERLEAFAKLVAEKEREACALEAEALWRTFHDTKDAHERNSPKPFMPERFGFDQSLIWQSRKIADAIRARGEA